MDEEIAAELEHTRFAAVVGYPSTARLLEHRLHLSCGEANARIRTSSRSGPAAFTGELLEPRLPHAAAAHARGRLGRPSCG